MAEGQPAVDWDAELQGVLDDIFSGSCCSWCKDMGHDRI